MSKELDEMLDGIDVEDESEVDSQADGSSEVEESTESEAESAKSSEQDVDQLFAELSKKPLDQVTVEDLRKIPGAEKKTDEELEALWKQVTQPPQPKLPFKLYGQDSQEVSDLSQLSATELLNLAFGYAANGKEQRKTLSELVRVAQLGHAKEELMTQLRNERNDVYGRYQEIQGKYTEAEQRERKVRYALDQYARGNAEPLEQLARAYYEEANRPPEELETGGEISDVEANQRGAEFYYREVMPAINKMAEAYGAKANEIDRLVQHLIQQEPAEFMSIDKLSHMLNVEVPQMLEQAGYSLDGTQQPITGNVPSEIQQELQALKAEVARLKADKKNGIVQSVKGKKVPIGGEGTEAQGSNAMPKIETVDDMKNFLRS